MGKTIEESDPELKALLDKLDQPDEPPTNVGPPGSGPTPNDKKPPRRGTGPRKKRTRTTSATSLEGKLTELFTVAAMGLGAIGDEECMTLVMGNGPAMAKSLDKLATESPAVKRALETTLESSAWVGVILTVGPTVYGIANHHIGGKQKETPEETPEETPGPIFQDDISPSEVDTGGVTLAWPTNQTGVVNHES